MDQALKEQLLLSINSERLVIIAGAGLSMAPPSKLPSALHIAEEVDEKYREITGQQLRDDIQNDLGKIADYFLDTDRFVSDFINQLVPWQLFSGDNNKGHDAIADFLGCRILKFALTTNFDFLIEKAAKNFGENDFRAVVDENELLPTGRPYNPLLKLHGCETRDRTKTIWTMKQFDDDQIINTRVDAFQTWMRGNIRGCDIVILGFWTDWSYINNLLFDSINRFEPNSVILVDPLDDEDLKLKAPNLWEWVTSDAVDFRHIQTSAADFLDELRIEFSKRYIEKILEASKDTYAAIVNKEFGQEISLNQDMSSIDLYDIRRDLCGRTRSEIVRDKDCRDDQNLTGAAHLIMMEKGAELKGPYYSLDGSIYRIINGLGNAISKIREKYTSEPPMTPEIDVTICVGAISDGDVPDNILRKNKPNDIIRPSVSGEWVNHKYLIDEIGE